MNTHCFRLLPCLIVWLTLPLGGVSAEPPPPPPSLADALAALPNASIADGSVVLSVQPDKVEPAVSLPPSEDTVQTPSTLAERYGRTLQVFSHVVALAPPTMTVLNLDPALAELPIGRLAVQHPDTYLLGSLTPAQFKQAATAGLAFADMTPDQQSLLHALLPEPLEIVPTAASPPGDKMDKAQRAAFDAQIKKVSGSDLFGALRFHAYLTADFYVRAPVGFGIGDTRELIPSTGAFKLPFGGYANMDSRGKTTETVLKADVPNTPKPADILWNRRDLERTVPLAGLMTVDSLVQRLGSTTRLELYADPHYASLSLLLTGDLRAPQPAGDLMQALALCVCGTWRKVGPAYVLTDDVLGLGTRQAFLAEIAQVWSNRLSEGGKDAGKQLQALDWLHTLSFVPGDIGALSPAQIDAIQKQDATSKGNLPWKSLPLMLRSHLKEVFLHYGEEFAKDPTAAKMGDDMRAAAGTLTPETPVDITLKIRTAVELPGTGAMMLWSTYTVQPPKPDGAAKPDTSAPARSIVLDKPLRGVLCAPKTPVEAQAVVAKMAEMKLNTLFLDVFTGGRTYFPNTALPPASADAGGVLAAALDAAKPLHIAVYAVLDTLCWRKDGLSPHPAPWPSGYAEDLTVTGETLDHVIQRRFAAHSLSTQYDHPQDALAHEGTQGWASPLDPAVRTLVLALTRTLAATPGLSGLAFQDTVPPGYYPEYSLDGIVLGYTPQSGLAYLHSKHCDPVDFSSRFGSLLDVSVGEEGFSSFYDISLPAFSSRGENPAAWGKSLEEADKSLLADCWRASKTAAPTLPLLLQDDLLITSVFNPWEDPLQTRPFPVGDDITNFSSRVTKQTIVRLDFGPDTQAHLGVFVRRAQVISAKDEAGKAGGEVFDLVTGGPPEHVVDTLDKLEVLLKKP